MQKQENLNSTDIKLPRATTLNLHAKQALSKMITLNETIESSSDQVEIAISIIEQKKILEQLEKEATRGNAIIGLAVMKSMIISGIHFSKFFDYTTPYLDNRGYNKIQELSSFDVLVPVLNEYKTLEKADSVLPFMQHLPNLNKQPFSVELFELLNQKDKNGISFQSRLFKCAKMEYMQASDELKEPILNIIKSAVLKGYPEAAILYTSILNSKEEQMSVTAINLLKSVQSNRFATNEQRLFSSRRLEHVLKPIHAQRKIFKDNSNSL